METRKFRILKQTKESVEKNFVGDLQTKIYEAAELLENSHKFPRLSRAISSGILIYGVSGCGKTRAVQCLANTLPDFTFFEVQASDFLSKYEGEALQGLVINIDGYHIYIITYQIGY